MSKYPANDAKFEAMRKLNLPIGQYAVTSSGPMGIRELREIGDIDLVLSDNLWTELAAIYPIQVKNGITTLKISDDIEALGHGSIFAAAQSGPSIAEQIAAAELIDGLPFVHLETILDFKRQMNRPKDAPDIEAIETWLANN